MKIAAHDALTHFRARTHRRGGSWGTETRALPPQDHPVIRSLTRLSTFSAGNPAGQNNRLRLPASEDAGRGIGHWSGERNGLGFVLHFDALSGGACALGSPEARCSVAVVGWVEGRIVTDLREQRRRRVAAWDYDFCTLAPSVSRIWRATSVRSIPTGHQVMQRPHPTQPAVPN